MTLNLTLSLGLFPLVSAELLAPTLALALALALALTLTLTIRLFPFVPAELLADSLELAISARVLDMRASPYDLAAYHSPGPRGFDLSPVRIETSEGRKDYQRQQAALALRAAPVRARMLAAYEDAIGVWDREEREAAARPAEQGWPSRADAR